MLVAALLPVMPASAATPALSISISEAASQANTYTPTINSENLVGSSGSITAGTISGTGTVTISNTLANTDLYDVTINLAQGSTTGWAQTSGPAATLTTSSGIVSVHFAKLTHGQPAVLSYGLASTAHLPIQLTTSYNTNSVPNAVGQSAIVTMTLTKDETTSGPCTVSNIAVTSTNALSGSPWAFSVPTQPPSGSGSTSVSGNVVTWNAANMATGATAETASYTATLANTAPLAGATNALQLFNMANDVVSYQINGGTQTAAGVSVSGSPTATTQNVGVQMTKELIPGSGYQFTPAVQNNQAAPDNVDFTLNSVNFWIVNNQNVAGAPADSRTIASGLPATIAAGSTWTGSPILEPVSFVPAGFLQPSLSIADANGQITRTYNSPSGTVTLMQTIYILNGYKIQVTKTVTEESGSPGHFDVSISVKNIGTMASPTVYVYDIVPTAWYSTSLPSPTNFNNVPVNGVTGTAVSNPVSGYAYYWNEGSIAANSAGPTQTYTIIGPSGYQLSQVWVVGVDPAQSVNVLTSPSLQNVTRMANANFESLAAIGAAGLLIIGMIGTARRRL